MKGFLCLNPSEAAALVEQFCAEQGLKLLPFEVGSEAKGHSSNYESSKNPCTLFDRTFTHICLLQRPCSPFVGRFAPDKRPKIAQEGKPEMYGTDMRVVSTWQSAAPIWKETVRIAYLRRTLFRSTAVSLCGRAGVDATHRGKIVFQLTA